ncbi:MAG: class I SAM-dependent methyltransferase [Treponemataceae bacterium]|nr:class I SAM-dependent methyltransferase [Treponemataceae bacterium]
MNYKCFFCEKENTELFFVKKTGYFRCSDCGGFFMMPESRLMHEKQKERYLKHNNTIENKGYVEFLESFIKPVLHYVSNCKNGLSAITAILDYGSGPEPVLVELLESYRDKGVISRECEIRGWDPFFAPDTKLFENGAELVTCLEVVEHFESPDEDFSKLASCVKSGGILAVGTMLVPSGGEEAFKNWWYRSDATHVSFYTEDSLRSVAGRHGLSYLTRLSDRVFVFKKH